MWKLSVEMAAPPRVTYVLSMYSPPVAMSGCVSTTLPVTVSTASLVT